MACKAFFVLATVLVIIAMTSMVLSHPEPYPDADPGYYGYKNYYGYYSDYKNYYGKKYGDYYGQKYGSYYGYY